ncbi:hypothetical protein [Pseudomonas putida]|uniref:hypothetical protein n=1 Tax=Pseudomonas putida TaxID=303 RepID=UPI00235DA0B0|nr:hypothetical protein [Pseudomonas putida]GLO44219.1 hypothetical protein PPUN109347_07810 [Pseudomonas putida]HDS0979488.1 hypothetical protein [Pseudomonas putida]
MKVNGNTRAYPIENQPHSVTEMNTGKQSSSSNKFAILPMWVIDRIKEEMRLGPAAWQAITDAVEQAEVPQALPCEVKLPPGTILGQGSPLSTLLMAIAQRASQPAHAQVFGSEQEVQQPHPEPIAWMVGTAFWWTKEEAERDAKATGLPMIPVGPITDSAEQRQVEPVAWLNAATGCITTSPVVVMDWDDEKDEVKSLYLHPPTSEGFSAGDMADQGAKAFAARDSEVEELRELLRAMTCGYRMAVQAGHARITALGGDCDGVDRMLADFPEYAKAIAATKRQS